MRILRMVLWAGVLVAVAGVLWQRSGTVGQDLATIEPAAGEGYGSTQQTIEGAPQIGGDFTLTTSQGMPWSSAQDAAGKHLLVYFGFTFCPDICPTDLAKISQVMAALGDDAATLQPVFITIDPQRDTPEKLKSYMASFDARMVALTGSDVQIAEVARQFKVYYAKQQDTASADYLMDHSGITYLLAPDRTLLTHFTHDITAEQMLAKLKEAL